MRSAITALALFAVAACNAQDSEQITSNENAPTLEDDGLPVGSDTMSATNESVEMAQPMGRAFPESFQGRWGLVAGDCTSTRGDAKGLLIVTGDTLRFYESRGIVDTLTIETPNRVRADLKFEGEGQTWDKTATFAVGAGGNTLVRTESDPALNLRYTRCPS